MTLLKKGSDGAEVRYLQAALNFHLYDAEKPLVLDGKFGPLTKQKTIDFQQRCKLIDIDGIVGGETTIALCTYAVSEQHLLVPRVPDIKPYKPAVTPAKPHAFPMSPTKTPQHPYIRFPNNLYIGVEGAQETNFSYNLEERRREAKFLAVANVTAMWSRTIRERVSFGLGIGYLYEIALQRQREYESKAYLFGKVTLKTFKHSGRFGLPIALEGRFVDPLDSHRAFCASLTVGPEIEIVPERASIGIGAGGTVCTEGHKKVTLSGSFGPNLSLHF